MAEGAPATEAGSGPGSVTGGVREGGPLALRLVIAATCAVPVVAHALERELGQWWLLAALFAAPALIGRRDPVRVLGATLLLVFCVPLVPTLLRILPFVAERVVVLGAAAWLALTAPPPRVPRPSRPLLFLRWALGLGLAWSLASALRGFLAALPAGAPWLATLLADLPAHALVPRPQVEPNHAFAALWLRLEFLGPLWLAAELAAARRQPLRRLVPWLAAAVFGGLCVFALDFWNGVDLRGESLVARLAQGLPRSHRPLVDNNALGTALVVLLPVVAAAAWAALFDRSRRGVERLALALALGAGLFLLVTSRSKAALGAVGLCLPVAVALRFGLRRLLGRRWVAAIVLATGGAAVGAQLVPESTLEPLTRTRYGEDAVRLLRLDVASDYLAANRVGPWSAATAAGLAAPLAGHGLGSLPRRMAEFRDPDLETEFNPTSENAHNQWLQSFAEEGFLGASWLALLFVLAQWGALLGLRRERAREPEARFDTWLAAGLAAVPFGLAINLQVGHSLLESAVAVLAGALLGLAVGSAPSAEREPARTTARTRGLALGLAVALGALPLLFTDRPSREGSSHGAYPWIPRANTAPGADRLLSTDARWFARWGAGDRMVFSVLDPRPAMFTEPLEVTVELDGELALGPRRLPRPTDPSVLPEVLFKLDRPAGVAEGDRVELRVTTRPPFATTFYGDTGRDWIGPRVSAPAFIDRR